MHFWRNVIFLDETYIRLRPKDSRERVWRQEGEGMAIEHVLPSFKFGGGGVMFWGCVSWIGPGPLVPIYDTLNGDDYGQLLEQNIPEVKEALNIHSPWIIEDGSRVHRTSAVLSIKEALKLKNLDLPPYSPDLNIIENMWSILKTRVAKRTPSDFEELVEIAQEEWVNFSMDEIHVYFRSIPNRIRDIVSNGGAHSKY